MAFPLLIADSGSTKIHWCMLDLDQKRPFEWTAEGVNPYFQDAWAVENQFRLDDNLKEVLPKVQSVYFYGSGVSTPKNQRRISDAIHAINPDVEIFVRHDVLGAARGMAGHEAGLIGILGTGCNLGLYDGSRVTRAALSLRFMLGDEGSGAVIGRELLASFFKKIMPEDLAKILEGEYNLELGGVLDRLYHQPYPNRYMAQFARFAVDHQSHSWCRELLLRQFRAYFRQYVLPFPEHAELPLHLVGSIANYAQDIVAIVADEFRVTLGQIDESPMPGLIRFHKSSSS
ncbi:MAG TPA: N-acetylglucosamine kinase [Cytophagales bacterium]|nr:N-acetylglucosamine kinase [Cytophagales bacterium]